MTQYVYSFSLIIPQTAVHVLAFVGFSTVNLISEDRNRHARHILISLLLWSIYQFSRGGNELIQTKLNAVPVFEVEANDKQFCWVLAKLTVSFYFSHGKLYSFLLFLMGCRDVLLTLSPAHGYTNELGRNSQECCRISSQRYLIRVELVHAT